MRFLLMPVAVDFADVSGRDEGFEATGFQEVEQRRVFVLGQQGDDLDLFFPGETALMMQTRLRLLSVSVK